MEVWRGEVTERKASDEGQKVSCKIAGHGALVLHRDLEKHATDGDEVVVAGSVKEGEMAALAIHRIKDHKVAFVDSSNHVLLLGFMGFLAIFFAIFAMKASGLAGGSVVIAYAGASVVAVGVLLWVISVMLAIKKASSLVEHGG